MRIVIAGAGPVGLTAALVAQRAGADVVVLESGDGLAAESRASTFHPPTLEMLAELGVYDELVSRGIVARTFQYRDRRNGAIAELDLEVLANDTAYPFRIQCEQSKLTPILLSRLAPETVRFNARVVGVDVDADRAVVRLDDGSMVKADWVIGADGASSATRKSLGIDFEGITYPERFLVVSTNEDLPALLPGIAPVNYVFDPDEWLVLLRTPEHWRILLPTPEDTDDAHELDDAHVKQRLRAVVDPGRDWSVLHTSLYRVHQRVVSSFRLERALLMGDAAHVNNPLGGMGMNSGIHDAVLLTRALVEDPASLDDLAAKRRDVALTYVRSATHANWERIREGDPAARAAVYDELRALAADPVAARYYLLRTSMIDSLRRIER